MLAKKTKINIDSVVPKWANWIKPGVKINKITEQKTFFLWFHFVNDDFEVFFCEYFFEGVACVYLKELPDVYGIERYFWNYKT